MLLCVAAAWGCEGLAGREGQSLPATLESWKGGKETGGEERREKGKASPSPVHPVHSQTYSKPSVSILPSSTATQKRWPVPERGPAPSPEAGNTYTHAHTHRDGC